jgi:hypothetical protein
MLERVVKCLSMRSRSIFLMALMPHVMVCCVVGLQFGLQREADDTVRFRAVPDPK